MNQGISCIHYIIWPWSLTTSLCFLAMNVISNLTDLHTVEVIGAKHGMQGPTLKIVVAFYLQVHM